MVKEHELIYPQRKNIVCAAFVVAELDFEDISAQDFHYRPHLSTNQAPVRQIDHQRDDIPQLNGSIHLSSLRLEEEAGR